MPETRMVPLAALRQVRARAQKSEAIPSFRLREMAERARRAEAEVERLRELLSEHGLYEVYEARRAAEREAATDAARSTQALFQSLARAV